MNDIIEQIDEILSEYIGRVNNDKTIEEAKEEIRNIILRSDYVNPEDEIDFKNKESI